MVMEANTSKTCRAGFQAGAPEGQCCSSSPRPSAVSFPLFWGGQSYVLVRPSTDWTRPTHSRKGNLLCSKSDDVNVELTQKRCHRNNQNNTCPHTWAL